MRRWAAAAMLLASCSDGSPPPSSVPDFDGGFLRWRPTDGSVPQEDGGVGPLDLRPPEADGGDPALADGTLDAAPPDASVDPCQDEPVESLTASTAAQRTDLLGAVVEVVGTLQRTDADCDPVTCPTQQPCCAECSAELRIDGALTVRGSECLELTTGCVGTSCGLVCVPPPLGLREVFIGRLENSEEGRPVLRLYPTRP